MKYEWKKNEKNLYAFEKKSYKLRKFLFLFKKNVFYLNLSFLNKRIKYFWLNH